MHEKRNVLITINVLCGFTGSEIHTICIAEQFIKNDFEVTIATYNTSYPMLGLAKKIGANVVDITYESLPRDHYDIFFSQHYTTADKVIIDNDFTYEKLVCVSLGSLEPYETLPRFYDKADMLVFISGSAKDKRLKEAGIHSEENAFVFSNYAPEEFFNYPYKITTNNPKRIAIVSNHIPEELLDFKEIATKNGCFIDCIGRKTDTFYSVNINARILSKYDAVVTIGKTVQYCFAMGIPVYCYDIFGGPGYIQMDIFERSMYHNFSGRCCETKRTGEELFKDIVINYNNGVKTVNYLVEKAREYFNLPEIFNKFLEKLYSSKLRIDSLKNYYNEQERQYIIAQARSMDMSGYYKNESTSFFYNMGLGFTAENSVSFSTIYDTEITLEIPLQQNIESIRFDPAENFCVCMVNELLIDGEICDNIVPVSNHEVIEGNKIAFLTNDPQYIIDISKYPTGSQLTIKFVLLNFESIVTELLQQITLLSKEISEKDVLIDQILSSTTWKTTPPIRKIKGIMTGKIPTK